MKPLKLKAQIQSTMPIIDPVFTVQLLSPCFWWRHLGRASQG